MPDLDLIKQVQQGGGVRRAGVICCCRQFIEGRETPHGRFALGAVLREVCPVVVPSDVPALLFAGWDHHGAAGNDATP
jgi:hypothetical protein